MSNDKIAPLPYIFQGDNVVLVYKNQPFTISKTALNFGKLVDAIKTGDWATVIDNLTPTKAVENFSKEAEVRDGQLFWNGSLVTSGISKVMLKMLEQGFDASPLENFMRNLYKNPSKRAVDELYNFIEAGNMPITPDGHFLAYKKIRQDYKDIHSGTIDNSVGKVISMERNQVDEDKNNTCSYGLHFCSFDYLRSFSGQRVVILKINPADVVAIPADYNNTKGRCARYEVIGEVPTQDLREDIFEKSAVAEDLDDFDDDLCEETSDEIGQAFLEVTLADTSLRDLYIIKTAFSSFAAGELSLTSLGAVKASGRKFRTREQAFLEISQYLDGFTEEEFIDELAFLVDQGLIANRYDFE